MMVSTEVRLIIFFAAEVASRRSSVQSAKTRPGAFCGLDHQLLTTKFRLKLKKIGKTTRPFRYDLYQIPYVSTVEVTNKFKGLDVIDRVPEVPDQNCPQKEETQKGKMLSEEALQTTEDRREEKGKGERKDISI